MKCEKCKKTKCKYVGKNAARKQRSEIWDILRGLNKSLKEQKYKGFTNRLVGSSKRNMVFRHGEELYDTDIQLEFLSPTAKDLEPSFKKTLNDMIEPLLPELWTSHISTSVITINKIKDDSDTGELEHYFDLAIIRKNDETRQILKGKNPDEDSEDKFEWKTLPKFNNAYIKFKQAKPNDVKKIKQRYIDRKCKHREIEKDDSAHRSSSQLFIECTNEILN
ncbi:hypothetical protein [Mycoplasma marinum]|uniref:Nucleotidyltransferase n=1 Tax=Mycoplasma marinum TaxID=1937190 RepID=A0A4R0XIA3_9MOLU|nr:hypothetical protein [Mycoplasma marinum]TCG10313.1 hypothetical protein C4B24_04845 [Mycoplasma marinum]